MEIEEVGEANASTLFRARRAHEQGPPDRDDLSGSGRRAVGGPSACAVPQRRRFGHRPYLPPSYLIDLITMKTHAIETRAHGRFYERVLRPVGETNWSLLL